jgi:hypothetical protein
MLAGAMTRDDGGEMNVSVPSDDSMNGLAGDEGNVESVGVAGSSGNKRGSMFESEMNCDPLFRRHEKEEERAYIDLRSCLTMRVIGEVQVINLLSTRLSTTRRFRVCTSFEKDPSWTSTAETSPWGAFSGFRHCQT